MKVCRDTAGRFISRWLISWDRVFGHDPDHFCAQQTSDWRGDCGRLGGGKTRLEMGSTCRVDRMDWQVMSRSAGSASLCEWKAACCERRRRSSSYRRSPKGKAAVRVMECLCTKVGQRVGGTTGVWKRARNRHLTTLYPNGPVPAGGRPRLIREILSISLISIQFNKELLGNKMEYIT